jgi:hypothetical protein
MQKGVVYKAASEEEQDLKDEWLDWCYLLPLA